MPYPLIQEDSSRISRRHRHREELLECFRLLREIDANEGQLYGTPRSIEYGQQMSSMDQRPSLQKLHGLGNTHRQQEMVPPRQHFQNYQHETKRRRVTNTPSIATQSTTEDDVHSAKMPHENKAKKRCVTFAPKIATYSTLPQQYDHEVDHERNQQHSTSARSTTNHYMTENDYESAFSRYPRMRGAGLSVEMAVTQHHIAPSALVPRASNLALPDHNFAHNHIARNPFGTVATFPSGPHPCIYSSPLGRRKPASLLPPHPLGKRAGAVVAPHNAQGTKRRAH
jgi:hypothetical protein